MCKKKCQMQKNFVMSILFCNFAASFARREDAS